MGDLIVKPAYQFGPTEILTAEKLNLLATPVVELALQDPVNDQNFFRNGNFYSSFWTTPSGISCPDGAWTTNASYWLVRPIGGAANFLRSNVVPDIYSLFSGEVQGALNVGTVEFGQQINGDLSATLRRNCTFSGYIFNGSSLVASPQLNFYTANAFNNFSTITLQTTVNLQSAPPASWTFMTATLDLSSVPNITNGLLIAIILPAGALNDPSKNILFSRLKFQIGEIATEFVDDPSLFIQAPSVDSTMLQDGCIARPSLFLPAVVPKGAYVAKSIFNGDISDGAIDGRTLVPSVSTTLSAGFTQPAVSATVPITVASTTGFLAGQPITIAGGGSYTIASVTDTTHMVVTNTGATGNLAPLSAVPTGGSVRQASAAVTSLGYTPINKAGDTAIGSLFFVNDDVVGSGTVPAAAEVIEVSPANAANDGYMPALSFNRPGVVGRAIGLSTTGRFRTVDLAGVSGYLLDSIFQVGTTDLQDQSVTIAKLAASVINMIIPPGIMAFFSGPNPPTGWLVADGSAVSRTGTTAALFAALGTYWGVGDNSTTFNLPDLQGRAPIGYVNRGASGITGRGFATRGGAETHQLSIAEMPGHDHGYSQSPHSHNLSVGAHHHNYVNPLGTTVGVNPGGTYIYSPSGATNTGDSGAGGVTDAQNANIAFAAQGGWQPHTIMQPFAVGYWIVKY